MHLNNHCLQPACLRQGTSSNAAMCAGLCLTAHARHEQPSEGLNATNALASSAMTTKSKISSYEPHDEIATASAGRLHAHWQYVLAATSAMRRCGRPVGHNIHHPTNPAEGGGCRHSGLPPVCKLSKRFKQVTMVRSSEKRIGGSTGTWPSLLSGGVFPRIEEFDFPKQACARRSRTDSLSLSLSLSFARAVMWREVPPISLSLSPGHRGRPRPLMPTRTLFVQERGVKNEYNFCFWLKP